MTRSAMLNIAVTPIAGDAKHLTKRTGDASFITTYKIAGQSRQKKLLRWLPHLRLAVEARAYRPVRAPALDLFKPTKPA